MINNRLSCLFLVALLATTLPYASAFDLNTSQKTIYGAVKGEQTAGGALVWQGIPYAKSPTADLRWKAPRAPDAWSNMRDATQPATNCIQFSKSGVVGKEDCLNVNIYRPASSKDRLPVLVYIHGGNNQSGSSTEFNPEKLSIDLNAVIVTVNYRLGVLGFNPLKALSVGDKLSDSGNFGLLDISQSLHWMKDNIAHFGGDKNNITVSGFSAGGRDVMAMLISPVFKGQFQKAIVFSGGMTTANKEDSEKVFANIFAKQVVEDGIQKDEPAARQWLLSGDKSVRDYLYRQPAQKLAGLLGDAGIRMSVFPHIYRDGYVIPAEGFDTASYNNVPLIMLSGQNEFSFFALSDKRFAEAAKQGTIRTDTQWVNQFNFVNHYGGKLYSLFNVDDSARHMYPKYQAQIYGAEFKFGTDPDVTGDKMALLGSFHGVFMPFFDSKKYAEYTGDAYNSAGARDLGAEFKSYLKNFLQSGNPNGQKLTEWHPWTPENAAKGQSLLMLDANRDKALVYVSNKTYSYGDVLRQMNSDQSVSDADKQALIGEVLAGRWFSRELDATYNNPSLWVK